MIKVLGVCSKYPKLKRYILWALHLLEDMQIVVQFNSSVLPGFDVYIMDDLSTPLPNALVVHMMSKIEL